ncbi:hypothetical protein [Actinomadura sp. KC216]|uniref:hypothetical protein n=1 Tax=Actinomadura sp. KC216 TaxID=2530370 RepID=UPI00140554F5|nr:hypothetical protein [Actinomadura sp. KC216]
MKQDGHWRVRYLGSATYMPLVSGSDHIDVKYQTSWYSLNAAPEPVEKGGTIRVTGRLYRWRDVAGPAPNAPVYMASYKGSGTYDASDTRADYVDVR